MSHEEKSPVTQESLAKDGHANVRDEQFWFTAAVVSFNGYLLSTSDVPVVFAIIGSVLVSLLGSYVVMTRWVHGAGREPKNKPDHKTASSRERWRYTGAEAKVAIKSLPYVIAECSGSLFYLLLIFVSFVGAIWVHVAKYCDH